LLPRAGAAVRRLNRLGLKTVVVSNQPGIAKGNFTPAILDAMTRKMERELGRQGARLDGIYYCLHHPQAASPRYRKRCRCRKPKPGLLRTAAKALEIDLRQSFMVGDNLTDVEAGKSAGCTTIFLGDWKCDWCRFMKERNRTPDHIVPNLPAASRLIEKIVTETAQKFHHAPRGPLRGGYKEEKGIVTTDKHGYLQRISIFQWFQCLQW
jgi:D-glycero-D-manno-heptose 1,7-bisphosphate phosphatase